MHWILFKVLGDTQNKVDILLSLFWKENLNTPLKSFCYIHLTMFHKFFPFIYDLEDSLFFRYVCLDTNTVNKWTWDVEEGDPVDDFPGTVCGLPVNSRRERPIKRRRKFVGLTIE